MGNPDTVLDAIVVGAGPAGLSASYHLSRRDLRHIVLERGNIGESWRSQRWDSFALNTPNWMSMMPGDRYQGDNPEGFLLRDEFVEALNRYVSAFRLPVMEHSPVVSLEMAADEGLFKVTAVCAGVPHSWRSRHVVVAAGSMHTRKIPPVSRSVPKDILQIHAADYRNPSQLPAGSALVVGSGQSGCQIAEDLLESGRRVFVSTSRVGRVPRRYRGRDILDWFNQIGFLNVPTVSVTDPYMLSAPQPQVSGVGPLGRSVSLQDLSRQGATILGRLDNAADDSLYFRPDAADNVRFADEFSARTRGMIDEHITRGNIPAEDPGVDPADLPDPDLQCVPDIRSLRLSESGISSIVWTTGFGSDFSWIRVPALNPDGQPVHHNGVSEIPGLYFVGFPWLRARKSGIIYGIVEDAAFVVSEIHNSTHTAE